MKRAILLATVATLAAASIAFAGDIGFIEDFSLATDRTVPLKQLIPGTEDFYYYHCLHYQNTGQFEKVPEWLKPWITRYGRTERVIEIENRQALLTYDKDPQAALRLIVDRLGLLFNHQREPLDANPNLPTSLDPKAISREAFTRRALSLGSGSVDGFEPSSYDWLIQMDLGPERRRQLLSRLARPDYPNLVPLVLADMKWVNAPVGFGAHPIHAQMLLAQLEELIKAEPGLINQNAFVSAYLAKLQPPPDVDWKHDAKAHAAYLDSLWAFASRLAPAHNSLKRTCCITAWSWTARKACTTRTDSWRT